MTDHHSEELHGLLDRIKEFVRAEVTANKTEFDDVGDQLAEFDIVISGRVGSLVVKWLIECRDRPSEGAGPGSWIEQLAARKTRFNFDKVIAVSTTGFAKGISEYAERQGVNLRPPWRIGRSYSRVTAAR